MRADRRPSIGEHAILGDCSSCVLVTAHGSIDWACLPQFDSPPLVSGLLDRLRGGEWWVRPRTAYRTTRRYLPGTNVLETTFYARRGRLRVTDFMAVAEREPYRSTLRPDHHILRRIECIEGTCDVETEGRLHPDFGRHDPRLEDRGRLGLFCEHDGDAINIRSDIPLHITGHGTTFHGAATLERGDVRWIALALTEKGEPALLAATGDAAEHALQETIAYWRDWSSRMTYEGPYRDAVLRSALTLKLLAFAPSGAIVAAPTTSLPEQIGGERNWDYRYCWLRDASFTVRALSELGYFEEAESFFSWVLHTSRRSLPRLRVLYDLFGNPAPHEHTVPHFDGYFGSRPVRVGNDASSQLQLDIYGTVISAAHELWGSGHDLGPLPCRMLRKIAQEIEARWNCPDEGIWESRGGQRRHTLSACMCAIGLEEVADMADAGLMGLDAGRCRALAGRIRREVDERGWNERLGSYVSVYGTEIVDASLLLLALRGYHPADHPRMRSTFAHLRRELAVGPLWYRYRTDEFPDGMRGSEGTFGLAAFWAAEVRARAGDIDGAREHFEALLGYAGDLGLYAEEIDASDGKQLGNFPQAYTHLGLINAAITLAPPVGEREYAPPGREEAGRRPSTPSREQELGT